MPSLRHGWQKGGVVVRPVQMVHLTRGYPGERSHVSKESTNTRASECEREKMIRVL